MGCYSITCHLFPNFFQVVLMLRHLQEVGGYKWMLGKFEHIWILIISIRFYVKHYCRFLFFTSLTLFDISVPWHQYAILLSVFNWFNFQVHFGQFLALLKVILHQLVKFGFWLYLLNGWCWNWLRDFLWGQILDDFFGNFLRALGMFPLWG